MKKLFAYTVLMCSMHAAFAQVYVTRMGQISFFSKTPMENIDAVNNEVTSMLNTTNGEIVYALLVKSFRFERALMEEHFNENYLESGKFPKAMFNGKISNLSEVDFKKDGKYPAAVGGDLTIHNVKRHVVANGFITVAGNKITINASLDVQPQDYDIKIPTLVADKIAENIAITVNCQYEPKQ